jgi:hypothetical protein
MASLLILLILSESLTGIALMVRRKGAINTQELLSYLYILKSMLGAAYLLALAFTSRVEIDGRSSRLRKTSYSIALSFSSRRQPQPRTGEYWLSKILMLITLQPVVALIL